MCGRGCLLVDDGMFAVITKTGQCAYGHDEKDTRMRIAADHKCCNH